MEKIVHKNIKVSSFYLKESSDVKEYFESLAKMSGGEAIYIDIKRK